MTIAVNVLTVKVTGTKTYIQKKNILQGGIEAIPEVVIIPTEGLCWPLPETPLPINL
jgi:hypothetical protein